MGAPWAPTPMSLVHNMLTLAEVGPDDTLYNLGCGDGRVIITAARHYGAWAVGIEIDPLRYLWCQILIAVLRLRSRVKIVFGDFFRQDLGEADVVTCYLLQGTNNKLEKKFKRELRPGTRVVSHYVQDCVRFVRTIISSFTGMTISFRTCWSQTAHQIRYGFSSMLPQRGYSQLH